MNAKTTQILVGYVEKSFSNSRDIGAVSFTSVSVPGMNQSLTISSVNGPKYIEAGTTSPVFIKDFFPKMPLPTDEVVMEVFEENRRMRVCNWAYAKSWRRAETEISRRPRYRVIRENRFQGQVMKKGARNELFFEGVLDELLSLHPRDGRRISTEDKVAPVYITGPFVTKNRFEVKIGSGGDAKIRTSSKVREVHEGSRRS